MSKTMRIFVGWGAVISGGLILSVGTSVTWGLTGFLIAAGVYIAIVGAVILNPDE